MTEPGAEGLLEKLASQLAEVAERQIDRVFIRLSSKHGPLELRELSELAERRYHRLWQVNRMDALREIISDAITELPDKRLCTIIKHDSDLTLRLLGYQMYNLACDELGLLVEDLEHVSGHKYSYLVDQTFEKYGFIGRSSASSTTKKNQTADVRRQLARILYTKRLMQNEV